MAEQETTLKELEDFARQELAQSEKGLRTAIIVKSVLLVIVLLYTTIVYVNVRRHVDADGLMAVIVSTVQTNLPSYKEEALRSLNASAPSTARDLVERVQQAVPRWRMAGNRKVVEALSAAAGELEKSMDATLARMIEAEKKKIAAQFPQASDAEKEAKLKDVVMDKLSVVAREMVADVHKQYSKDISKLQVDITRLQRNQGLSKKEQYQRQVLACWVRMVKNQLEKLKKG